MNVAILTTAVRPLTDVYMYKEVERNAITISMLLVLCKDSQGGGDTELYTLSLCEVLRT